MIRECRNYTSIEIGNATHSNTEWMIAPVGDEQYVFKESNPSFFMNQDEICSWFRPRQA
jgi:hypothetical protein